MTFDYPGGEPLDFGLTSNPITSGVESFQAHGDGGVGEGIDWNKYFPMDGTTVGPVDEDFDHFESDADSTSPVSTTRPLDVPEPKVPAKRKSEAARPKRNTRKKK
ncbi:hypothetical protein EXIGLDRAFT_717849 [Exidia glandulosa HHB12029]|uniref:Uncharacterized protein n=1 Tax=Exidia glandulosa HHB12029 TaxID=1314781 RepID=A0A165I4I7_EXIGL|nr:hypothetical protein EXIGLDRAFT_717849 [Exidia glandulosa HHB12029]